MMHNTDRADFKEARAIAKERSEAADALKQKAAMEAAAQEEASRDPEAELAQRRAAYEAEKQRREYFGQAAENKAPEELQEPTPQDQIQPKNENPTGNNNN